MNILLDTTVLVDALRRRGDRPAQIEKLLLESHVLSTSAVNVAEVLAGMREGEERRTEFLLARLPCHAITLAIARRAGELKRLHARKGQTIALPDTIIAATALEHGLLLMTENTKDFPFADLQFYPAPQTPF